jgi:hypothetical protein
MAKAHPTDQPLLFGDNAGKLKRCSACKCRFPFSEFHRNRAAYDGFNNQCKRCAGRSAKKYKSSDKSRKAVREWSRRNKGLRFTEDDYKVMHAAQRGLCAICGQPQTCKTRAGILSMLHIDHDHTTKKVRQLLCGSCNRGLGCFRDSPNLLQTAIDYLLRHTESIPD